MQCVIFDVVIFDLCKNKAMSSGKLFSPYTLITSVSITIRWVTIILIRSRRIDWPLISATVRIRARIGLRWITVSVIVDTTITIISGAIAIIGGAITIIITISIVV